MVPSPTEGLSELSREPGHLSTDGHMDICQAQVLFVVLYLFLTFLPLQRELKVVNKETN